tara:strand:+ start:811 stop:1302 length:492 start_codon:yes stop_codon:yes gene_type:complete
MTSTSKERAKEKAKAKLKSDKVNVAQLDKLLNIQKTPDPPRKTWYRTHGKVSGLGIMAFWATLFEGNELLPKSKKMTNAEIERQVRAEFPHEQTLLENLDSGRQSVNYYRHLYNKGRMSKSKGAPPQHISFRYNEEGLFVDTRAGKRMLDEVEIEEYAKRYQG